MYKEFKPQELVSLSQFPYSYIFSDIDHIWDILPLINEKILSLLEELKYDMKEIKPGVLIGEGTTISPTATILGPAIIGKNVEIRHGAFIRQNVIIGDNAVIGNSCEIKNSILFNNAQIPHFNYVGDSVIGFQAHIGAGVILSNVKSIKGNVNVIFNGQKIDTNLRKFGAILGDFSEIGCNTVLNPGTIIGREAVVYPLSKVRGVVPASYIYKDKDNIVPKKEIKV
ncbi:MAG: UDP-N-acetylglucosamine pyrophosphorylase [Candidatus Muiribacterium halophilum]|uniref:UDP-N-acetylglucosamine pyrophosphorylase n=1 Tax=Muiribacterium halophilum TaxID=2053465 RepID=A0A2N5ZAC4_MUIH1|nr:MAG: UDP-N-acetylglucosamine pyrophosphorylase [Candidatus Muirbacterium halophilum]